MSKSTKIGAVVAVALVGGCASVPETPNYVTFRARQMPEVVNILVSRCAANGGVITTQTANTVVCEKEMEGGSALMTQFAIGNAYTTPPVAVLAYTLTSNGMDTTVYWNLHGKVQGAFGQVRTIAMNGNGVNAGMHKALATAGAE